MTKVDDKIELVGVVEAALPGGRFRVILQEEGLEGHVVRARLSGKMRMHYIRIVPGDRVRLQVTPHNLDEGLIVYRMK